MDHPNKSSVAKGVTVVGFCDSCGAPACTRHPGKTETWNDVLDALRLETPEPQTNILSSAPEWEMG